MKIKLHIFYLWVFTALLASTSNAATIKVENSNDSGSGSLRNAIVIASSGDTIHFKSNLTGDTIFLTSGEIVLNKNLRITGLGSDKITINGSHNSRIFVVDTLTTIHISGLAISGGFVSAAPLRGGAIYNKGSLFLYECIVNKNGILGSGEGGAIFNTGSLHLNYCTVSDNEVFELLGSAHGGAIFNTGDVSVLNSNIIDNAAVSEFSSHGGGIVNGGTMILKSSTVSRNIAVALFDRGNAGGGGIDNGGSLTLINCTVSLNTAASRSASGGGIVSGGYLEVINSTITENDVSAEGSTGGGIANGGTTKIGSAIVANNSISDVGTPDIQLDGTIIDLGYNLVGVNPGTLTNPTNISGTELSPLDPMLDSLKDNGGTTLTHALLPGSPALDAGDPNSNIHQDQRGFARPFNNRIDIGSFEFSSPLPLVTIVEPEEGTMFYAPAAITISALVEEAGTATHLRIKNLTGGWRKLKLGYDSLYIYRGMQDVIAGGNDTLEITLKDFNANADWSRIEVRPNGSKINPVALAPYVAAAGGVDTTFITIKIPLSAFNPSIDFTKLILMELPYSVNAAPFDIAISKIIFTGGSDPFLWFGDDKTNNAHDGSGTPGQLLVSLEEGSGYGGVKKVEFYSGKTKIGEDFTPPFSILWEDVPASTYFITAKAAFNNNGISKSEVLTIYVLDDVFAINKQGANVYSGIESVSIFPNPTNGILEIKNVTPNGQLSVFDMKGNLVFESVTSTNLERIDISNLPQGLYSLVIVLEGEKNGSVIRFVKQ